MKRKLFIFSLFFLFSAAPISAASIELSADKKTVAPDETFTVTVTLSGGEPTFGTDLIFVYDPQAIDVVSVTPRTLYPSYQPTDLEHMIVNPGTIIVSGSSDINQPVAAAGEMAQVMFKAKQNGTTYVGLEFKRDSTTTSGIIGPDGSELLQSGPPSLQIKVSKPFSYIPLIGAAVVIGLIGAVVMFRMKKKHQEESHPEVVREPTI